MLSLWRSLYSLSRKPSLISHTLLLWRYRCINLVLKQHELPITTIKTLALHLLKYPTLSLGISLLVTGFHILDGVCYVAWLFYHLGLTHFGYFVLFHLLFQL
ncbi:hypothetical protein AMTRI_Chr03g55180 [Amborella trichopoda]